MQNFDFFSLLATPRGMQDLSSLTRDQTRAPRQWKQGVLTTGPPGKSLVSSLYAYLLPRKKIFSVIHHKKTNEDKTDLKKFLLTSFLE